VNRAAAWRERTAFARKYMLQAAPLPRRGRAAARAAARSPNKRRKRAMIGLSGLGVVLLALLWEAALAWLGSRD
jgi:hypothetical protein